MWSPQRPKFWSFAGDFGFWILGILDFGDFGFGGFWILDFGAEIQNPKSPNPKSKIQTFLADFGDFGFWSLDRYVANLYVVQILGMLDFGFWGFWILDLGILDFEFWILGILDFGDFGFWILGILDFGLWGFWILDFGPLCSKSLCEAPNAANLGIWNFGFWGFWGFWILDFEVGGMKKFGCKIRSKFWILHKSKKM